LQLVEKYEVARNAPRATGCPQIRANKDLGHAHDIQQFLDGIGRARTPKGLEQLLADVGRAMGFDFVTMFHHVDLSDADANYRHMQRGELVGLTNASVGWCEHYRDHNLVAADPRVLACRTTVSPFRTDEISQLIKVGAAQKEVIARQELAGIGEGFTIPIHFPGEASGSCTFSIRSGRALPVDNLAMAQWIGSFAFQAARTMVMTSRKGCAAAEVRRLTKRQLQCTVLVGRGLCEGEIGRCLGISAETVKRHLKEARMAYGVTKSVQLITHTLRDGYITMRDIFDESRAKQ
jgi:LuxR family quorum-sensing system transcriptional regulator CciR